MLLWTILASGPTVNSTLTSSFIKYSTEEMYYIFKLKSVFSSLWHGNAQKCIYVKYKTQNISFSIENSCIYIYTTCNFMFLLYFRYSTLHIYVILWVSELFLAVHSPSGVTNIKDISLSLTIFSLSDILQILIYPYFFMQMMLLHRKKLSFYKEILKPD